MILKRRKLYIAAEFQLSIRPVSLYRKEVGVSGAEEDTFFRSVFNNTTLKIYRNSKTVYSV